VQHGEAKITSGAELLRLILLHAGADMPLRQTVTMVAQSGGPQVSHVTLHKKMRLAAPFLKAVVGRLCAMSADAEPARWAGYELAVVDGSSFCGPGANGTDARVHLQLRLSDLEILSATVADRTVGESFKRFTWRKGQLAIGDRGYANPPGVASVVQQTVTMFWPALVAALLPLDLATMIRRCPQLLARLAALDPALGPDAHDDRSRPRQVQRFCAWFERELRTAP
jgi:hypothetical protein